MQHDKDTTTYIINGATRCDGHTPETNHDR